MASQTQGCTDRGDLRDEEAAGSNPATPTQVRGPFLVMRGGPPSVRASLVRQGAESTTQPPCRARPARDTGRPATQGPVDRARSPVRPRGSPALDGAQEGDQGEASPAY